MFSFPRLLARNRLNVSVLVLINIIVLCLEVAVTAEDEKKRDPEGYAAIKALHAQMDDDKSGSIDRSESADVSKI